MIGWRFSDYEEQAQGSPFEKLLDLFKELLLHTSGDVDEALSWLTQLDKEHGLTTGDYGIADFIEDLKKKGYIQDNDSKDGNANFTPTAKTEASLRKQALKDVFGQIKKGRKGKKFKFVYFYNYIYSIIIIIFLI